LLVALARGSFSSPAATEGSSPDRKGDIKQDLKHKTTLIEQKDREITAFKKTIGTLETQNRKALLHSEARGKMEK